MDNHIWRKNKARTKIILFEDWFVRGKKLRFGVNCGANKTQIDVRINERIFDKPHIKTVVWGNV